ncbi:Signal transduction histidine kinase CheA [Methanosarcina siciliae C2J]|uniref:Chemotaxis protein CheA n=2 Tax=Methanosarcina siciliae TaxID=38027 RepID=A0A0E3PRY9_9EURY|nr:Signal transduction histidine kinase CheA [Methanosarcina siciliae C2J]
MDMSKYMAIFRSESEKYIKEMSDSLLALELDPENIEQMNVMFRAAHTFKGMAATMGFRQIVELTHEMESLIDGFRTRQLILDSSLIDILFECLDVLEGLVENVCKSAESKNGEGKNDRSESNKSYPDAGEVLKTLRNLNNSPEEVILQKIESDSVSADRKIEEKEEKKEAVVEVEKEVKGEEEKKTEGEREVKREEEKEANEIKEDKKETEEGKEEKGGEKERDNKREKKEEEGREEKKEETEKEEKRFESTVDKELESINKELKEKKSRTDSGPNFKVKNVQSSRMQDSKLQSPKIQSSRISTEQLDKLMNLVGELVINRSRIKELTGESKSKDLEFSLSEFRKLTRELQEEVLEIRMVPLDHVTNIFPRMIRDLARAQNKKINFVIRGKEIKLDRAIMEEIGDPLVHLLRNAVDHGIELPEQRVELGKEETGTIMITASKQQNYVLVKIEDDGRGINAKEILKAALEKGFISRDEAEQLSERETIQLIFAPGLTTASTVTDLSGRGVGMDVVKNRIERLGGSVKVESKLGFGSRFELRLPITIALYQAMLVKVGMERYAIPFTSIVKSISVRKEEVRHISGEEVIVINEKTLPLLRLRKLFQLPAVQKEESLVVVIVEKAGQYIGLVVDSLLGKQEVIIKNFKSRLLEKTRGFAGATILGDGCVILILDVNSII